MTTEFKARLSPWLSNHSTCLRPVPLLSETLKEEQREEEGKMKDLLSILMMISTYALLMETWKITEAEMKPCKSRQKWLMQKTRHGVEPGLARLKVTELFTPLRATAPPRAIPAFSAFAPGSIFDLRYDRDGLAWDLLRADHRRAARLKIKEEEPYLVVGSPSCVDFTDLFHNLRAHKVDPRVVRQRRIQAEILLRFARDICEMQMAMGNHFLHEHPAGADSWKTPCGPQFAARPACCRGQCTLVHVWLCHQTDAIHEFGLGVAGAPQPRMFTGRWTPNCRRERSGHSGGRVPRKAEQGHQRLREGRGPPQPAVKALRLGTGLYNLSRDTRDKPMKVDCAILQDHVKDEEEELQENGSPSQQVRSRVQEKKSARSWKVGECEKRLLCRSTGGGRGEDPLGPSGLT